MKSIFHRFFGRHRGSNASALDVGVFSASSPEVIDVQSHGFPLVPDAYHLLHVGLTAQGNGYWITPQFALEEGETRDFVSAYIFDKAGNLISCEVVDQGRRKDARRPNTKHIVQSLKLKIDARQTATIWVKPFSVSFHGQIFGLIVREPDQGSTEKVVDAMPGWTLMFHGPWSGCNYAS